MNVKISILENDKFFNNSPNAGEPDCICSRCFRQIQENELMLRVAVNEDIVKARAEDQGIEVVNGVEFRLCVTCLQENIQKENNKI